MLGEYSWQRGQDMQNMGCGLTRGTAKECGWTTAGRELYRVRSGKEEPGREIQVSPGSIIRDDGIIKQDYIKRLSSD